MHPLRIGPLVRATSTTCAVLWMECSQPCTVTISLRRDDRSQMETATVSVGTVTVGSHYYAAPHLQGLKPGTWYSYQVSITLPEEQGLQVVDSSAVQCFRTLQASTGEQLPPLRLIYGSCRKLDIPEQDTLEALGHWLLEQIDERETAWPHLLLLIGDQIYGDEPPPAVLEASPHLCEGARNFEDFTRLYEYHWTSSPGVRQVLAALPIYMMFDDHEILNGWNIVPNWGRLTLQSGKEQVLIDGLVAYWVYQGWGNVLPKEHPDHPLLQAMQAAEQSGEDVLAMLQTIARQAVYGKIELPWHYTIPTTPPIFMTNTRADRSSIFPESAENAHDSDDMYAPGRIMSKQQMADLYVWYETCRSSDTGVALMVSSAPVLLPPLIGFAEYLMGRRFWHTTPLHRFAKRLAQLQLRFIERLSFDHWPAYAATWQELLQLAISQQKGDMVVLSGDVHFSYAARARKRSAGAPSLYQLVSTPIQNALSVRDKKIVSLQAWITKLAYSGLHTSILPLEMMDKHITHTRHHIFQNTLAAVTLTFPLTEKGHYKLQQEYLSVIEKQLHTVAHITISSPEH